MALKSINQEQFNAIKSYLERVVLPPPPHINSHDTRCGIKREDQTALNLLSKCGRYVTIDYVTCLKFLGTVNVDGDKHVDSNDYIKPLIKTAVCSCVKSKLVLISQRISAVRFDKIINHTCSTVSPV